MHNLPALDAHAHIDGQVSAADMESLGAAVLAATRSLDEAESVSSRNDRLATWGVGVHPGLAKAVKGFDEDRFVECLRRTVLVSEVGLDGGSRVPMELQKSTLSRILTLATQEGSIISLHSSGATREIIEIIDQTGARGVVLHWWLGTDEETRRAAELGCYFSINGTPKSLAVGLRLPQERILTETDHPFGDRSEGQNARPGRLAYVERSLAQSQRLPTAEFRRLIWRNFGALADELGAGPRLAPGFRDAIAVASA